MATYNGRSDRISNRVISSQQQTPYQLVPIIHEFNEPNDWIPSNHIFRYGIDDFNNQEQVFDFILNIKVWQKILVDENLWNEKKALQDILNLNLHNNAYFELFSEIINGGTKMKKFDNFLEWLKHRSDMINYVHHLDPILQEVYFDPTSTLEALNHALEMIQDQKSDKDPKLQSKKKNGNDIHNYNYNQNDSKSEKSQRTNSARISTCDSKEKGATNNDKNGNNCNNSQSPINSIRKQNTRRRVKKIHNTQRNMNGNWRSGTTSTNPMTKNIKKSDSARHIITNNSKPAAIASNPIAQGKEESKRKRQRKNSNKELKNKFTITNQIKEKEKEKEKVENHKPKEILATVVSNNNTQQVNKTRATNDIAQQSKTMKISSKQGKETKKTIETQDINTNTTSITNNSITNTISSIQPKTEIEINLFVNSNTKKNGSTKTIAEYNQSVPIANSSIAKNPESKCTTHIGNDSSMKTDVTNKHTPQITSLTINSNITNTIKNDKTDDESATMKTKQKHWRKKSSMTNRATNRSSIITNDQAKTAVFDQSTANNCITNAILNNQSITAIETNSITNLSVNKNSLTKSITEYIQSVTVANNHIAQQKEKSKRKRKRKRKTKISEKLNNNTTITSPSATTRTGDPNSIIIQSQLEKNIGNDQITKLQVEKPTLKMELNISSLFISSHTTVSTKITKQKRKRKRKNSNKKFKDTNVTDGNEKVKGKTHKEKMPIDVSNDIIIAQQPIETNEERLISAMNENEIVPQPKEKENQKGNTSNNNNQENNDSNTENNKKKAQYNSINKNRAQKQQQQQQQYNWKWKQYD